MFQCTYKTNHKAPDGRSLEDVPPSIRPINGIIRVRNPCYPLHFQAFLCQIEYIHNTKPS